MVRILRVAVSNGRGPWVHVQVTGINDRREKIVGNAGGCALDEVQETVQKIVDELIKTEKHVSLPGKATKDLVGTLTLRHIKAE